MIKLNEIDVADQLEIQERRRLQESDIGEIFAAALEAQDGISVRSWCKKRWPTEKSNGRLLVVSIAIDRADGSEPWASRRISRPHPEFSGNEILCDIEIFLKPS